MICCFLLPPNTDICEKGINFAANKKSMTIIRGHSPQGYVLSFSITSFTSSGVVTVKGEIIALDKALLMK
jgi:hypothetical protein